MVSSERGRTFDQNAPMEPGEKRGNIERRTKQGLDKLIADNPIIDILNPKTLSLKFARFIPERFDPVHIVRVMTADGVKEFIYDGYHRTATAKKHWDEGLDFRTKDTTDTFLDDPNVVPQNGPKQTALKPEQFAKVLILPTQEQPEIEKQRMSGHTLNLWDQIVGKEFAKKYSALYGLTFLASLPTNVVKNQARLSEYLQNHEEHFMDLQHAEREKVSDAMLRVNGTLPQINLSIRGAVTEVISLIGKHPESIGGIETAKSQLEGLFLAPPLKNKLEGVPPITQSRLKTNLYQVLSAKEKTLSDYNVRAIFDAFVDPTIDMPSMEKVLNANTPRSEYEKLERAQTIAAETARYKDRYAKDRDLTTLERALLGKTAVAHYDVQRAHVHTQQARETFVTLTDRSTKDKLRKAMNNVGTGPGRNLTTQLNTLVQVLSDLQSKSETAQQSPDVQATPSAPPETIPHDRITELTATVREQDETIRDLREQLREKDATIQELRTALGIQTPPEADTPTPAEETPKTDRESAQTTESDIQNWAQEIFGQELEQDALTYIKENRLGHQKTGLWALKFGYVEKINGTAEVMDWNKDNESLKYLGAGAYLAAVEKERARINQSPDVTVRTTDGTPTRTSQQTLHALEQTLDKITMKLALYAEEHLSPEQTEQADLLCEFYYMTGQQRRDISQYVSTPGVFWHALGERNIVRTEVSGTKDAETVLWQKPPMPDNSPPPSRAGTDQPNKWVEISAHLGETGSGKWFTDLFKKNSELHTVNRNKVTALINNKAKNVLFPKLKPDWEDVSSMIKDHKGNTGMEALDNSLSNRLAGLTKDIGWDKDRPEFVYLSGSHYLQCLKTHQEALLEASSDSFDTARYEKLNKYEETMQTSLDQFGEEKFGPTKNQYTQMLQVALYAPPTGRLRMQAIRYLREKTPDGSIAQGVLQSLRTEYNTTDAEVAISRLFRSSILGEVNTTED